MHRNLASLIIILMLSGCASVLSDKVLEDQPSVPFSSVKQNPDQATGKLVIVGGSLLGMHEVNGNNYLEVLEQPLDSRLRPIAEDYSEGRFLIKMEGDPDPGVWAKDRLVTLAGRVEGVQSRALGQTTYPYPVFTLEEVYLWPEERRYYSRPQFGFGIGGGFSF